MKIAIIYYKYPLYDKGSYIQEQVDAIAEQAKSVVLVSSKFPKDSKFKCPKNLKILWIKNFNIPIFYDVYFNFAVFFKALFDKDFKEVDVINVVCARGVLAAIWLKKMLRKKLVLTIEIINDPKTSFSDKVFFKAQKYLYTRSQFDKIICWSKYYYNLYLNHKVDQEQIIVFVLKKPSNRLFVEFVQLP